MYMYTRRYFYALNGCTVALCRSCAFTRTCTLKIGQRNRNISGKIILNITWVRSDALNPMV